MQSESSYPVIDAFEDYIVKIKSGLGITDWEGLLQIHASKHTPLRGTVSCRS